jgi:hypothetical protein
MPLLGAQICVQYCHAVDIGIDSTMCSSGGPLPTLLWLCILHTWLVVLLLPWGCCSRSVASNAACTCVCAVYKASK